MRTTSRRIGALALTAAMAAVVLTACSADDGSAGGDGEAGGSMTFVGAGGVYQEAQTEGIIDPFMAETGINVYQDSPLSYAKLEAMVDANNVTWDVMEAYPYFAIQRCDTHLEKLDYDVIDTSEIDPQLVLPCAVPAMKSALILVYDADVYTDDTPSSWADFFDEEKFPGTRGIMNDVNQGALEAALLADGVSSTDLYPVDFDRAFDKLDTLNDVQFIATGADQEQALANGTVDMMLAWPGRALAGVRAGANLVPVWNQAMFYNNAWVVPKGAPNKKQAMEFLNFALQAEPQRIMAEGSGYAPINDTSTPDFSEVDQQFVPNGQDEGTGFWRDSDWWAKNLSEATERWTAWSAG